MTSSPIARSSPSRVVGARKAASPLWLILGLTALVVSIVFAIVGMTTMSAPVSVLGVLAPLGTPQSFVLNLVGYLLTPMAVVIFYGIDRWQQRIGLRNNRNFVLRPAFTRVLWWLMLASLVVGAWHAVSMSIPLSESWGLS